MESEGQEDKSEVISGIHSDRAAGGNFDHRDAGFNFIAGVEQSSLNSACDQMRGESQIGRDGDELLSE